MGGGHVTGTIMLGCPGAAHKAIHTRLDHWPARSLNHPADSCVSWLDMRDTRGPDLILYGTSRLWLLRCYCCFCFCCRHASAATSSSRLTQMGMSLQGGIIGLAGNQIVLNVHLSVGARLFGLHSAEFWLVTPPTPSLTLLKTDDEQDPITTTGDGKGSGNVAALTDVTNLFRHGEDGFACVRSPSLLLAGTKLLSP